jgi:hypothetical protein
MYPANIKGMGINRAFVRRKKGKAVREVSHSSVQRDQPRTI